MNKRTLGSSDISVSAIGLGCMGMSEFYGPTDRKQALATLAEALAIGVNFWDTADMYGNGHNEELLGEVLATRRDEVVLATKFGVQRGPDGAFLGVCGRPDYVTAACDASLRRLGVETIDLYYQHRVDKQVPIEDTVGAMADLVTAGKVRHLGLSEAAPATLRRAAAVHPIAALQTEYSLWSREVEGDILTTCRELGTALVAYSPLGRGFLTGHIQNLSDLADDDYRRTTPRFQGTNFRHNLVLVERLEQVAATKSCTTAQLALAWLLHQGDDVVPIPGTRRIARLQENAAAGDIALSGEDLASIAQALPQTLVVGERYPAASMAAIDR